MKPKEFTEAYMPEMMATLGELIAIPSVFDEQSVTVGKPLLSSKLNTASSVTLKQVFYSA